MKRTKIHLALHAAPRDYDPGYPALLSPDRYRALIAPQTQLRLHAAVVAAGLAIGAPQGADDESKAAIELERQVLDLVRSIHAEGAFWYDKSQFPRGDDEQSGYGVSIPISFGNSHMGVFDAGRARELAHRIFGMYGIELAENYAIADEKCQVVLDGYDAGRKVGFELRGRVKARQGMFDSAQEEPPEQALDDEEWPALQSRGARLHVADVNDYPLMDGDQFTPQLAHLASVVDFLNTVTDGPDLDLSALLFQRGMEFSLRSPASALPDGSKYVHNESGWAEASLTKPTTLRFAFATPDGPRPRTRASLRFRNQQEPTVLESPISTLGAPTVIAVDRHLSGDQGPEETPSVLRVVQKRADLPGEIRVESTTSAVFLPSAFDAAQPFSVELDLGAGQYRIASHALVGAPRESK